VKNIFIILSFAYVPVWAQMDTVWLSETIITPDRLHEGLMQMKPDSLVTLQMNSRPLSESLFRQNGIYLKAYGPGGLQTVSLRGLSASQTAVLWNGISLQSPMNGVIDLALIPSFFIDNQALEFGTSSALNGNSAMGGALILNNSPKKLLGLANRVLIRGGSFGNFFIGQDLAFVSKKFSSRTRFISGGAKNNFNFSNPYKTTPAETMRHAKESSMGLLQELNYKWGYGHQLFGRIWYQKNDRQIPPTWVQNESKATQNDVNLRANVEYVMIRKHGKAFFRTAFLDESIRYTDPLISLKSKNRSKGYIGIAEFDRDWKMGISSGVLNATRQEGKSSGYIGKPNLSQISLGLTHKYHKKKTSILLAARQLWANGSIRPFTASAFFQHQISRRIRLNLRVGNAYRLPTLNDLYWNPGGNPKLEAERSWNAEFGFHWQINKQWDLQWNNYLLKIENYINWVPGVLSIWQPQNVAGVWGRGHESELNFHKSFRKFAVKWNALWHLNLVSKNLNLNDYYDVTRQIAYVPANRLSSTLTFQYHNFSLRWSNIFTSNRFLNEDHDDLLKAFYWGSLVLSWDKNAFSFLAEANNLYNSQYQLVNLRPMPPLNGSVGVQYIFKQKKKPS
jgi:iron complex outermembrane receptor protein